jgi:hypothetical protein
MTALSLDSPILWTLPDVATRFPRASILSTSKPSLLAILARTTSTSTTIPGYTPPDTTSAALPPSLNTLMTSARTCSMSTKYAIAESGSPSASGGTLLILGERPM